MLNSQFKSLLDELPRLSPQQLDDLRAVADVLHQALTAMTIVEATDALRGVVGAETLMCIDGSTALRGAAKSLGAAYHSVAVSYVRA